MRSPKLKSKTAATNKLPQKDNRHIRDVILEAAMKLFAQKGYEGTSIDEIREAVGFKSKASLYNHFKDKKEISDALTTQILGQIEKIIIAAYKSAAPEPLAQFKAVFQAYINWGLTHRQEFVFRIIRAQESRMLTGKYDFLSTHPSQIFPTIDQIIKQLRAANYPVRPIADGALFHMVIGAIARAVIDRDTFGDIDTSEKVEQVLQVSMGIVFGKPVEDFS